MSDFPEDPKEAEKYLKEKMDAEIPELNWHTKRSLGSWTAKGYKGEKNPLTQEDIRVVVYNTADRIDILVYDSNYSSYADKLSQRIREDSLFGDGVTAEIGTGY